MLVPACGQIVANVCLAASADPGVFAISPTATGRIGSSWGFVFDIALTDSATGAVRFTPRGAGAHVTLPGALAFCFIDFTIDVLSVPTIDQDPLTDGVQTVPSTEHTQHNGGLNDHVADAGDAVTITPATPAIATSASLDGPVGSPVRDSAAVSGRVTPLDGATLDFRLYGPDDVACSGPRCSSRSACRTGRPPGSSSRRRSPPPSRGRTAGSRATAATATTSRSAAYAASPVRASS